MTVKELKKALEGVDDDLLVGDSGHFGEYLPVLEVGVMEVYKEEGRGYDKITIFKVHIEGAGEEPD